MSGNIFIDTNILVYARDPSDRTKHEKAAKLVDDLWVSRRARISVQVLNEYMVTVTRKLKPGMTMEQAWDDVSTLSSWEPVGLDWSLLELARMVQREHSISWWDALIIAAANRSGCDMIYSEDLAPGHVYGGVRVINPFLPD
jgi:predicted nucleic acid-binding protein